MSTLTGSRTRTITGQLTLMLEHPRFVIARDVDFSNCRNAGTYNQFLPECTSCRFGTACKWLTRHPEIDLSTATVSELLHALGSAADYITDTKTREHPRRCDCDSCRWLPGARQLLRRLSDKT